MATTVCLAAALAVPPIAAQESTTIADDAPWEDYLTIADEKNICNLNASENPFTRFSAKSWREEFRINCWFPVKGGTVKYFIKTYDWGAAPSDVIIGPNGVSRPPIDIWVRGLHENDHTVRYRESLTLYRFICAAGTNRYAAVQFVAYDAEGKEIERWERPNANSRAAIPDSKEEAFANAVCYQ